MQLIHCLIIVLLVSYFPFVFGDVTTTQQLAIEGDIDAQYNLGMIYQKGTGGVSKDDIQAFYWYERSAQAGHDMAQYELAQIFFLANTETKVQSGGMYWLEESAYQGNIKAQYELAQIYINSVYDDGITDNSELGIYWLKKSAHQGYALAQYNLGYMYHRGKIVLQNYKKSSYWLKESAYQGNIQAQYELGFIYYKGEGVPQNYKKSHYWFHKNNK